MIKIRKQLLQEYRGSRNRHIIVSVLVMTAVSVIIVVMFHTLYTVAQQNVLNIWDNNVIQLAKSTEYYLARPAAAIEFGAVHVEEMIADGKTKVEIGEYLVSEKDKVASLVNNNYTGVYGCCKGVYLDASGWVPEEGYEPTRRPWYIAARENKGKIALAPPFLNLQTNKMTMSVSKLLNDGESVLSIDIFTDGLQETLDDLARGEAVKAAFIMAGDGTVVVHSQPGEMGKNYLKDGGTYRKKLADRARFVAERDNYYEAGPSDGEILLAERINNSWYAVLLLDEANLLGPVRYLNIVLVLFLLLVFFAWYGITKSINRRYREAEELYREMSAVADIYEAMTMVDLKTGRMTVLRNNDNLERLLEGNFKDYTKRIIHLSETMAADESRGMLMQFMDPSTYEERLRDVHSVSFDFLSAGGRWLRVQLIVVDRDAQGKLSHIIWAVESIDRERKQQEHLRKLAEIDALSGLYNRRTGEGRIRAMLSSATRGMFILLDVDDFKTINDRFGHAVGDYVITAIADCLRRAFRDTDILFRLGGDEFAVFVPGIEQKEAKYRLIQRLHHEISCISIPEMAGVSVTVSLGISDVGPEGGDSFESLYQRADQEMYENKRKKHNSRLPG